MRKWKTPSLLALLFAIGAAGQRAQAVVVYDTGSNLTGVYTPFGPGQNLDHKFGDSGWVSGSGAEPPVVLDSLTLGLTVFTFASSGAVAPGTVDLLITVNNGDPSGLGFGDGATLYSTTVTGLALPGFDAALGNSVNFDVVIPLPNVALAGGFNNLGWSVGVANYDYSALLGFQTTGSPVPVGFDVFAASEYVPGDPGNGWHTFGFAGGIANFRAVATAVVPEPGAAGVILAASLTALRRRREGDVTAWGRMGSAGSSGAWDCGGGGKAQPSAARGPYEMQEASPVCALL